jgi:AbrB family looped-hinge helix DNA binding protein
MLSKSQYLLSILVFCEITSAPRRFAMTTYPTVKVSQRYQIAVPAKARARLNINSGDRLIVDIQDGMLILIPEPADYAQHLAGLHKEIWDGVDVQKYIHEERSAWDSHRD